MADERTRIGRYLPGSWALLCGERTWLLADVPGDPSILERLWSLLDSLAELAQVLEELSRAGLERVPSFALIHLEEGAEKAVLRGVATIRLGASDGTAVELSCPSGVTTWLECPVGGRLSEVHLSASGQAGGGSWLPISGGVALASVAEVGTVSRRVDTSDPDVGFSEPAALISGGEASREDVAAAPTRDLRGEVEPADSPHAQYDFLFEATQRRTIEEAAVREPENEGELPAEAQAAPAVDEVDPSLTLVGEPDAIALTSNDDVEEVEERPPDVPQAVMPSSAGGLIVSVPGVESPSGANEPARQPVEPHADSQSEIDDRTVSRARIEAFAAVGAERPLGPVVKAVPCPSGHPNPPHNATCRVCGVQLGPATPVTVPRPVLGVLRLSTGASVPLDRGAIFGRSPEATSGEDGERPHVVRLPSPNKDISRNHLEVRLDGWHVLVTDLRSTNGTLVTVPGEQPQRLRPEEPFPIPPGTIVNLADEVTFVYEVEA